MTLTGEQRIKTPEDEAESRPEPAAPPKGLTQAEAAKLAALADKRAARPDGPKITLTMDKNRVLSIGFKHDDPALAVGLVMADLGTSSLAFTNGILSQIAKIGAHGDVVCETNSNFLLSVVRAVQPRDELETMLAVQLGATHAATMMMARRLNHVETMQQQDAAERALNKLARTYTMQMDALKRYRTGGQQKVTVEHVTVNAGGQAIVGNVARGGEGR